MKVWTIDEVRDLRTLYQWTSDRVLAAKYRTVVAEVRRQAAALALAKDPRFVAGKTRAREAFRWSREELDRLRDLYPDHSNLEIARLVGRSEQAVKRMGRRLGLRKHGARLKVAGLRAVSMRRTRVVREELRS